MKYALEGLIVALAAFTIPNNKLDINETVTIALVAMCTFSVLDYFAPSMAGAARLGAGVEIAKPRRFPGGQTRRRYA
jgi:hypothetical protein